MMRPPRPLPSSLGFGRISSIYSCSSGLGKIFELSYFLLDDVIIYHANVSWRVIRHWQPFLLLKLLIVTISIFRELSVCDDNHLQAKQKRHIITVFKVVEKPLIFLLLLKLYFFFFVQEMKLESRKF